MARAIRPRLEPRLETIQITYPDGQNVVVPAGFSVLEASRFAKIPHASVCGGRGRCSTCRVRIVQGGDGIPPASVEERRVLDRVGVHPMCAWPASRDPGATWRWYRSCRRTPMRAPVLPRLGTMPDRSRRLPCSSLPAWFYPAGEAKLPYNVVFSEPLLRGGLVARLKTLVALPINLRAMALWPFLG